MYNKYDRSLANDRFRATMKKLQKLDQTEDYRNKIIDLNCQITELRTKVDIYEKYISRCVDHDSIELKEVYSFDGELYRMVSREDKHDADSTKTTVCCKFQCLTPTTKNFKKL